ncbi:MAG: FKBP-type peptidyl-prolyl cis-trans isomerase [Lachnospiraceae bacterium]|nr:FKBP-type peptidyl-prolyl cis-trans isomerase [Lachnospiraceae bacterium]
MKKILLAVCLSGFMFLMNGCTLGGNTETGDVGVEESSAAGEIEFTDETVDEAGVNSFIRIPEYKGIQIERDPIEVTEEELEEVVQKDLNTYLIPVPNFAIADLFWVTLDYVGTIDGKEFMGGTASDYKLKIGTGAFPEEFEKQLLGHMEGDKLQVKLSFPEDYSNKEIAGKQAVYDVEIIKIEVALGEPTQDWLNIYFNGESVDEYMESKKAEVIADKQVKYESELIADGWYKVLDASEVIRYPKNLVETWISYSEDMYARYAANYGMEYEEFLSEYGVTEESIRKYALSYSKTWLAATAIMQREGITTNSDEYNEKLEELLNESGYPSKDAAAAAGITAENIDMATRYYLASRAVYDNAIITDRTSEDSAAAGSGSETGADAAASESKADSAAEETPAA